MKIELSHSDPLDDPDPATVANSTTIETLLRCWIRETGVPRPSGDTLTLPLPSTGIQIVAKVNYWSPVGWHRFGQVATSSSDNEVTSVADAATIAALLAREGTIRFGGLPGNGLDLVFRVLNSARHITTYVTQRRTQPENVPNTSPFLIGEQALILGSPWHVTSKGREGFTEAEEFAFSPELRGSFALHWFAADEQLVASDSVLTDSAAQIVSEFTGDLSIPNGMVALPAHPWQARDLVRRPPIAALLASGALTDLGPAGPQWWSTSSVRTVYRPEALVMLKLSLGVRITNSRRENLRSELRRGIAVSRLLATSIANELTSHYPSFDIVRDPGWLALNVDDEQSYGLDVVLRDNPFLVTDEVTCVAGLVAERPGLGPSHLATLIRALSTKTGSDQATIAQEWMSRYIDKVIEPVLWLSAAYGIGLEAHQQNSLVMLDAQGWPTGGRYRDNQGYYFAESYNSILDQLLPEFRKETPETNLPDSVVDERICYYLGINNLLGVIGAFGSQGIANETDLLKVARNQLRRIHSRFSSSGIRSPNFLINLLNSNSLPCKGNMLTRLHNMDELIGSVTTQSAYVKIPNPLV